MEPSGSEFRVGQTMSTSSSPKLGFGHALSRKMMQGGGSLLQRAKSRIPRMGRSVSGGDATSGSTLDELRQRGKLATEMAPTTKMVSVKQKSGSNGHHGECQQAEFLGYVTVAAVLPGGELDNCFKYKMKKTSIFRVSGATGPLAACNGEYRRAGEMNGRQSYCSPDGLIYYDDEWLLELHADPSLLTLLEHKHGPCFSMSGISGLEPPPGTWPCIHHPELSIEVEKDTAMDDEIAGNYQANDLLVKYIKDVRIEHGEMTEYDILHRYRGVTQTERTWIVRRVYGLAGSYKVLDYNLKTLVQFGGIMASFSDGSLFMFDSNATKFVVMNTFSLIAVLVILVLTASLETLWVYKQLLEDFVPFMSSILPFVLGMYLSLALQRWWALRTDALGVLFDAVINTCMFAACKLPGRKNRRTRILIIRWALASILLLIKAARDTPMITDLYSKELLSLEETRLLHAVDSTWARASIVWSWILRLQMETFREGEGPPPQSASFKRAMELVLLARQGISTMDQFLSTQLPFAYVHLITMLVTINTIFVTLKCAVASAVFYTEFNYVAIALELSEALIVPLLYYGLLSISYIIHDPFGEETLDFPIMSFIENTARSVEDVLRAQETFPVEQFLPHHHAHGSGTTTASAKAQPKAEPKAQPKAQMWTSGRGQEQQPAQAPPEPFRPPPGTDAESVMAGAAAAAAAMPLADEINRYVETIRAQTDQWVERIEELTRAAARGEILRAQDVSLVKPRLPKTLPGLPSITNATLPVEEETEYSPLLSDR